MKAQKIQKEVFRKGSKTYFNSSLFFPKRVKRDVFTLYAFVRVADDFVDNVPQQKELFYQFKESYYRAINNETTEFYSEIILPFVDLVKQRNFDPRWVDAFLHSMEMDINKAEYDSLDETLEYIYGSAEVIGLMMSAILGLSTAAYDAARKLGRAMQYINFIRDLNEDDRLGRRYIPIGETKLPDLSKQTAEKNREIFAAFLRSELDRFQVWQQAGEEGYKYLPKRVRVPIKTAADMYLWTARVIKKDPMIVFQRIIKPSKMRVFVRVLFNLFFC